MARIKSYLGTLTIANSETTSNIIGSRSYSALTGLVFFNPAAFTNAIHVEVARNHDDDGTNMVDAYLAGTQVTLTAGEMDQWNIQAFEAMRIVSASTEGAERIVLVYGVMDL